MDDDESMRQSMRRVLRGTCRVLEAGDAATALETLRRHAVDVVLSTCVSSSRSRSGSY